MIPYLFIDGPAHGRLINVHPDAMTWLVEYGDTFSPMLGLRKAMVYQIGAYLLPKKHPLDHDRIVCIATPNGNPPLVNGQEIMRLAAAVGLKDHRGQPV